MISIIVCTYNRADSLKSTLLSLFDLKIPARLSVELILVDNNSTDSTKEVASSLRLSSPFPFRYFFEEKKGLSFARNRGLEEATGEILAFTDDDVLVEGNWLQAIEDLFTDKEVACAGGKIHPLWEEPCPKWLTHDLYNYLALLDLGDKPKRLKEPLVYGANFVVRAAMFEKYGLFNTAIGRTQGKLYAGEESDFIERLMAGNEKVCYCPDLVVHHFIPSKRMKKSYFRKWIRDNGELIALQLGKYSHRNVAGVPFFAIKELGLAVRDYLFSLVLLKPAFKKQLLVIKFSVFIAARLKYRFSLSL